MAKAKLFPRIASNYGKLSYYPTDEETMKGIGNLLSIQLNKDKETHLSIFDPCIGEAEAALQLAHQLNVSHPGIDSITIEGIELDVHRAESAQYNCKKSGFKSKIIQDNFYSTNIGRQTYDLLMFNPPYGNEVNTRNGTSSAKPMRLEKRFYREAIKSLKVGGVLVYVIPYTSLDTEHIHWLERDLESDILITRAATDQFKQVVVIGTRKVVQNSNDVRSMTRKCLRQLVSEPEKLPTLEAVVSDVEYNGPYDVPTTSDVPVSSLSRIVINHTVLVEELAKTKGCEGRSLWSRFTELYGRVGRISRSSLTPMGQWHTALALASGAVAGVIKTKLGYYIIQGRNFRVSKTRTENIFNNDGEITGEKVITISRNLPVIKCWDAQPASKTYGELLELK